MGIRAGREGFCPARGGALDPRDAWDAVRPVLLARRDELRSSLAVAPQTNEPARTLALLIGVSDAVHRSGLNRVRLLEPGASGGLGPVSYTHLRAHETVLDLVCRLLLEKKKTHAS